MNRGRETRQGHVPANENRTQTQQNMNALQINAEIYRNLGIIAEDESSLMKAMKYVRKLAEKWQNDPTRMSKEEYFAMLDRSKAQAERGEGRIFTNKEDMHAWLDSL